MSENQFTAIFHQLTPKPRSVLILLLEGKQDEEIAQEIGASEATVRKHIQNLCDRFEVPSEVAGIKKNRRQELIVLAAQYLPDLVKDRAVALQQQRSLIIPPPFSIPPALEASPKEPQDWGDAPDVSVFYGRTEELDKLQKWILDENCRLLALLGMAGMGKTTLSVKLAHEIEGKFDYIMWRSLRGAPPLSQLLADLIRFLSPQPKPYLSDNVDRDISILLEYFRDARCLLILDNFDTILRRGDFAGYYQDAFKDYSQLLKRIGQEPHQSCLILTSLEKPREIALFEGEAFPVRALQVEGLGQAARELLKAKGLSAEERWAILIKLYRGNPLALKMVASTIQELFGGNVANFLDMSLTGIVQDIIFLIEQQFERLSPLEKDIMYWLAIEQEPVDLPKLRDSLPIPELDLFTALKSLGERSLIEKGSGKFSLQPAVMEYVRNHFVQQVCQEIDEFSKTQNANRLKLLRSHALNQLSERDKPTDNKTHSMINLFKQTLLAPRESRNPSNLVEQLEEIIVKLKQDELLDIGYAKTNLQNLLLELKGEMMNGLFVNK
jgi:hypothetical protein